VAVPTKQADYAGLLVNTGSHWRDDLLLGDIGNCLMRAAKSMVIILYSASELRMLFLAFLKFINNNGFGRNVSTHTDNQSSSNLMSHFENALLDKPESSPEDCLNWTDE